MIFLSVSFFIAFWFPFLQASEDSTNILILKSSSEPYYNQVVNQIKRHIDEYCVSKETDCNNIEINSFIPNESKSVYQDYDLVITLGLKARGYADRHLPQSNTINAMIPRSTASVGESEIPSNRKLTILLDQPFLRSLHLIKRIIHPAKRVGVLLGTSNHSDLIPITKSAENLGITIVAESIEQESDIGRKLSQLLDKVDVLLAQPDVMIYNRNTVSQILLSSYRKNIPVVGYSAAYVKAGALAAVYSSPEDIGNDIGMSITQYFAREILPTGSTFPRFFSVSINRKVGESLGIQIDSEPEEIVRYIKDSM